MKDSERKAIIELLNNAKEVRKVLHENNIIATDKEYYELIRKAISILERDGAGWVSVKDRLPVSGNCVLLYSGKSGVAEGSYDNETNTFIQWRWSVSDLQGVTHWQPRPEPPKEASE